MGEAHALYTVNKSSPLQVKLVPIYRYKGSASKSVEQYEQSRHLITLGNGYVNITEAVPRYLNRNHKTYRGLVKSCTGK